MIVRGARPIVGSGPYRYRFVYAEIRMEHRMYSELGGVVDTDVRKGVVAEVGGPVCRSGSFCSDLNEADTP